MKAIAIAILLTSSACALAQDNHSLSFEVLDDNKKTIIPRTQMIANPGEAYITYIKSYPMTECSSTDGVLSKKFTSRQYTIGYSYTFKPKQGVFILTEYSVDDEKYHNYNISDCFNNELKQIKTSTTVDIKLDGENRDLSLPNGNTLKISAT